MADGFKSAASNESPVLIAHIESLVKSNMRHLSTFASNEGYGQKKRKDLLLLFVA